MGIAEYDTKMAELITDIELLKRLIKKLEMEKEVLLMANIPF